MGWPLYMLSVWSVVISQRYLASSRNWAQFDSTEPLPPYVISSCGYLGSTRVIQRRFNVSVPRARAKKASTRRERSER